MALTWLLAVHLVGSVFFKRCTVGFALTEWEEMSHQKATAPITRNLWSLNVKLLCINQCNGIQQVLAPLQPHLSLWSM